MSFSGLPERVAEIRQKIADAKARGGHGQGVRIIAVTKTHGPDAVLAAVGAGLTDVGENKVQEAIGKQDLLAALVVVPGGILAVGRAEPPLRWHLVGHLQRNKVKFLDRFSLFQAADSSRLVDEIDALGITRGTPVDVLLEVNVSGETSKGGYAPGGFEREAERIAGLKGIKVCGVMTMAPFDADEATLRRVFSGARAARTVCERAGLPAVDLSMGMSADYEVAVEEGATMVRLGTVLFGERTP
ncbi:YggS family pyridoxal phosphate enzyme [Gemmatimonadota bacterium]|nr:YggS family pyridoxal phosphate enzyme [Gemmatimonadota bacterium]